MFSVRNSDAAADARRSKLFSLQERLEDLTLIEARHLSRPLGERLDHLLLAVRLQ